MTQHSFSLSLGPNLIRARFSTARRHVWTEPNDNSSSVDEPVLPALSGGHGTGRLRLSLLKESCRPRVLKGLLWNQLGVARGHP